MDFSKIVLCDDFSIELNYCISKNYKNDKILIVTTRFFYNKYQKKFNSLNKTDCILKFVFLPDFAINNRVFSVFLLSKIEEDVSAIFCLGGGSVCDVVKFVATQQKLPYILIPVSCSSGGYALNSCFYYDNNKIIKKQCSASEYIIVDKQVIKNTPKRMVASCYGQVVGYYINILDYAFNKTTNTSRISIENIKKIEDIVLKTTLMPVGVLSKQEGIVALLYAILKLETIINSCLYEQSSVDVMSLVLANFLKGKLQYGEIYIISATVLVEMFYEFFSTNKINSKFFPNIGKRINNIKTLFNSDDVSFTETITTQKRQNDAYKFMAVKDAIKSVSFKYKQNIANCLSIFKHLYNDHAVFMQKYLNKYVILNSLAVAADVYLHNNILTFMRNFGLLDIL